jgi:hypothetical protein
MAWTGRPPIYETVDEIIPLLEVWEENIKSGKEIPTVTGLTLALGFADKSTLYDYVKKPEFSHPIKKALTIVEFGYEKALKESNAAGSIFALKNMGWKDKTELDHTSKGEKIEPFIFTNAKRTE